MDMEKVKNYIEGRAKKLGLFLDQCHIYDEDPEYLKVVSFVDGKEMKFKVINKDSHADIDDIRPLIDNKLKEMVVIKEDNKTRKF